jgi:hypothetical protein
MGEEPGDFGVPRINFVKTLRFSISKCAFSCQYFRLMTESAVDWVALRITPLTLRVETLSPFSLPEYKGAIFRGGFGKFFRDLVCTTRAPVCAGCPHLRSCPYSAVFETPVLADFQVLRKYPNAPHPFVLVPPLDARVAIPARSRLDIQLTLLNGALERLPHIMYAFEKLGASGRFGGSYRVMNLVSAVDPGHVVYDGAARRFLTLPAAWRPKVDGPVGRMRVEFRTPLRLRTEGRYNSRPDFVAVTQALLRRMHLLSAVHGGGIGDASWMHPLLAAADQAVTERAEFAPYRWSRMSGRQERRVDMDGVVGVLAARGELTSLAEWYQAGEWVNVGSGTSMGLGRYRIETAVG